MEQKPHSQKERQDEKAEGYVPDEGTKTKQTNKQKKRKKTPKVLRPEIFKLWSYGEKVSFSAV